MNILIVFATSPEAEILKKMPGIRQEQDGSFTGRHKLYPLITGVGGMSTAWSLKQWLSMNQKPDLAINAGIAGSYSDRFRKGDVVMPVTDCFADLGIEKDGKYLTLFEAGLSDRNEFPFEDGMIVMRNEYREMLARVIPEAAAVTINTASGSSSSIERILKKFHPDIETMEGATFFYICSREKITFLALRAISNFVEPGKRSKWEIPLALGNLAGKMGEILNIL